MKDSIKQGWVRFYRKSMDSTVWKNPIVWTVWSWCLLKANHSPAKFPFNGEDVELFAGQFVTGRNNAIKELPPQVSAQKWRTAINYLKSTNRIAINSNNQFSIITILNWNEHQKDNQKTNQPLTSEQPATNQPLTTNKNNKELKNEKNNKEEDTHIQNSEIKLPQKKEYGEFSEVKLTDSDYAKLIKRFGEDNTKILIAELDTGIASKGYKYKNHYATLLNWARRKYQERKDKIDSKIKVRTLAVFKGEE